MHTGVFVPAGIRWGQDGRDELKLYYGGGCVYIILCPVAVLLILVISRVCILSVLIDILDEYDITISHIKRHLESAGPKILSII